LGFVVTFAPSWRAWWRKAGLEQIPVRLQHNLRV
jgi:hypothetical protein